MTRSLNGKVAVITGAGSGMGRSMALRLAEDDAKIAIWDINGEGAEETARLVREAGGTAIAITADVRTARRFWQLPSRPGANSARS